jgi:hypothetical protein
MHDDAPIRRRNRSWPLLLLTAAAITSCADLAGPEPVPEPASAYLFFDDFRELATGRCAGDGAALGAWDVVFTGYGCVRTVETPGGRALEIAPQSVAQAEHTSAPLVAGPRFDDVLDLRLRTATLEHLRTGSEPNPWEVGWVVWHYIDPEHFYYFIAKPNGWELGKRDPAYPGGQRFLATGNAPRFPIRRWYDVRVVHVGTYMSVYVDGDRLVGFRDEERPYTGGRIALYNEDAVVRFADVSVSR